jgi:hypothetical protein
MPLIRIGIGPDGPVIDLAVCIGLAVEHGLQRRGRPIPSFQTVRALIDTGADRTAIHPHVLASINSPAGGTIRLRRPGSASAVRNVDLHDVRLAFAPHPVSGSSGQWVALEAVAVVPADPSIMALRGRSAIADPTATRGRSAIADPTKTGHFSCGAAGDGAGVTVNEPRISIGLGPIPTVNWNVTVFAFAAALGLAAVGGIAIGSSG